MPLLTLLLVRLSSTVWLLFFFFNDTATTEIYTLSYTTLFRSQVAVRRKASAASLVMPLSSFPDVGECWEKSRSEEHTSELQSPMYLVCRLLLEKKKKTEYKRTTTTRTSAEHHTAEVRR